MLSFDLEDKDCCSSFQKQAINKHKRLKSSDYKDWYETLPTNKKLQVLLLNLAPHKIVNYTDHLRLKNE
jgi:hypothetical protein